MATCSVDQESIHSASVARDEVEHTSREDASQDYDFVEQPDQDFYCPVSLEILLEPHQTLCCGHHISQEAANRLTREGKPCPMCKSENLATQEDKYFNRKVKQLKVCCPHKKSGCVWVGELGDLNQHSTSCPNRPWKCQHCNFETTYEVGTNDHTPNCTKYPEPCPNRCEIGTVPRCDVEKHLLVCSLQLVECEFAHAGCDVKVPRGDLAKHMTENAQHHLMSTTLLNLRLTRELHQKMEEKGQQIVHLQQQVKEIKQQIKDVDTKVDTGFKQQAKETSEVSVEVKLTHQQTVNIDAKLDQQLNKLQTGVEKQNFLALTSGSTRHEFTLTEFKKHQAKGGDGSWFSDTFYNHLGGYCFALGICTNGSSEARGTHLSALLYLLPGANDDKLLKWPMKCTVYLQMLNQRGDHGHHTVIHPTEYKSRGYGILIGTTRKFFPLAKLGYCADQNTEYLKNDCLKFQLCLKVEGV